MSQSFFESMNGLFARREKLLPPLDGILADSLLEDCRTVWLETLSPADREKALGFIAANDDLLLQVFAASSFLTRIIRTQPAWLVELAENSPAEICIASLQLVENAAAVETRDELMTQFRQARQKIALTTALADIAGIWGVDEVTAMLTRLADTAIQSTMDWLLDEAVKAGELTAPVAAENSGLIVLAMGKYGAGELNYSSDIDLVVFYDPQILPLADGMQDSPFWVGKIQSLSHILQTITEDGYVFRVDLRLRPDPGAMPVAVSLPAAEIYYEAMGQNWERAAFIKARQVYGDVGAGAYLQNILNAFIWRRHLDFAAIEDVHAMKRQIHAVRGHGRIAVAGHNVKLGRGGIREIEFFVQTQQLIAGGRDEALRGRRTCEMLTILADKQWIEKTAAQELTTAYHFLRKTEHRLQMMQDEQTHILPQDADKLAGFASFMGFVDSAAFAKSLTGELEIVQKYYANLFEQGEMLASEIGNLVFTGTEDDPETIVTLEQMGFTRASHVVREIRSWHSGRLAATRSPRARELLTRLKPRILQALADTPDPDLAFARFHDFLTGLPAGVQIFSLFQSNPDLLNLIADITGTAPRLSGRLSRRPAILDTLLDQDFNVPLPDYQDLRNSLERALNGQAVFEAKLDATRIWAREKTFRVGAQILSGQLSGRDAGQDFTKIAESCVEVMYQAVLDDLSIGYELPENAGLAVLAMGKLGGREMTAASDLDLIMVCDAPDFSAVLATRNEAKPLDLERFFARMTRRLISALTSPTAEGELYEVDFRLRPSGNAGPLVTKLAGFEDYQQNQAWLWEHMALTRMRVIAGPDWLADKINQSVRQALMRPREQAGIVQDILDMRRRLIEFHHKDKAADSHDIWDIKQARGGLVEIEFIAQGLTLIHAPAQPKVSTSDSLSALQQAGVLTADDTDMLLTAFDFYSNLQQVFRLCLNGAPEPPFSQALILLLCQRSGLPDMRHLETELAGLQKQVAELFEKYIGPLA